MGTHHAADHSSEHESEPFFPAQSTVLDESALLQRIVKTYRIGQPESCRFLCRGAADVYRVVARGANYYLKIYRPPSPQAHAESEARFLARLSEAGLPVVRAVPRTDGTYACQVLASEGPRPILLFEEAPPPLPGELVVEQMTALGQTVARMHELADADSAPYDLPTFDLDTIEVERAQDIRQFASEDDAAFMTAVIDWMRPRLAEILREAPEWGICHGDLVLSNVRVGEEGVTLFDFGNITRTYRGLELAIVFWSLGHRYADQRAGCWKALLGGYESIRSLPDGMTERLPIFLILRELAFLGGNATSLPLRLGTEPFESSFMSDGFNRIRSTLKEAGVQDVG